MYSRAILTLFFLILALREGCSDSATGLVKGGFLNVLEDKLEKKLSKYTFSFTKILEEFNDRHLGASEWGRMLNYKEIKPVLDTDYARGRTKKLSMAMMPLVFHVGATSTWMLITSIMAAKSVAIGLVLLVFKIAVSSAKLASFFTLLKGNKEHHHGWIEHDPHIEPYVEHHQEPHSEPHPEHPVHTEPHTTHQEWSSYSPEYHHEIPHPHPHPQSHTESHVHDYHTIPVSYRNNDIPLEGYNYNDVNEDKVPVVEDRLFL